MDILLVVSFHESQPITIQVVEGNWTMVYDTVLFADCDVVVGDVNNLKPSVTTWHTFNDE